LRLVVLSSTEAEYCGGANAYKEVLAQKQLFTASQLDIPEQYPVLLDNQSAIALALWTVNTSSENETCGDEVSLSTTAISTPSNRSTILTKDLGSKAHRRHRDVIFGKKAIEIIANKLPDSYRMYRALNAIDENGSDSDTDDGRETEQSTKRSRKRARKGQRQREKRKREKEEQDSSSGESSSKTAQTRADPASAGVAAVGK
jgi:hypothetical protein